MYTHSIIILKIARKINRNVDFPGFFKLSIHLSVNLHRKLREKVPHLYSSPSGSTNCSCVITTAVFNSDSWIIRTAFLSYPDCFTHPPQIPWRVLKDGVIVQVFLGFLEFFFYIRHILFARQRTCVSDRRERTLQLLFILWIH